jgi:hypothetical protein
LAHEELVTIMNATGPHDPFLAIPGLDIFLGQQMIAEVDQDVPYLQEFARTAEFGYRITASGNKASVENVLEGRLPVAALADAVAALADAKGTSLRSALPTEGTFVIEAWITPESAPRTWVELGLTHGGEISGIEAAHLEAALLAMLRSIWDGGLTADFLGFELFTTALRKGPRVPAEARAQQKSMLAALASKHLEKAMKASAAGDRMIAADFATAAAGCLGVPRHAILGLTATTKYAFNTGRLRPGQSQPALPENLQRLLDTLSPPELQRQSDLIAQAAGRLVEEGRAAWCERQNFLLQQAGFPFLCPVPPPIPIGGYGTKIYLDGMKLIEKAASRASRWVFLSSFLTEHLILSGWSWLLAVTPPSLLKELATEARVLPEDSVKAISTWEDNNIHWATRLAELDESSNLRAVEVAQRLL